MRLRSTRPLGRLCTNRACNRRSEIPLHHLYFLMVAGRSPSRMGGSCKEAAFDCPKCGHQNLIPSAHLPKGTLGQIPSRQRWLEKQAQRMAEVSLASPEKRQAYGWQTGAESKAALEIAIRKVANDATADIIILVGAGQEAEDIVKKHPHLKQAIHLQPARLLPFLDEKEAQMMVLGGRNPNGSQWRMIFNPRLGVSSIFPIAA